MKEKGLFLDQNASLARRVPCCFWLRRVNPLSRRGLRRAWLRPQGGDAHLAHQPLHPLAVGAHATGHTIALIPANRSAVRFPCRNHFNLFKRDASQVTGTSDSEGRASEQSADRNGQ